MSDAENDLADVEVEETSRGVVGPDEPPAAEGGAQDVATERSGPLATMDTPEPDLEMAPSDGSEEG